MNQGAAIIEESAQIDAIALRRARRVAAFDADREYEQYGCPNTVAFLKVRCNLSTSAAMEVMSVAQKLHALPAVEAAAERGQIGFQQAAVLAESADLLLERQEEILAKAEELDPSRLRVEVKRVAMEVDAERMAREAEWAYRSRRLKVHTMADGRVRLEGLLDSEGGVVVKTALEAALGPRAKDEIRSTAQRWADGLVDVARRALDGRQFGTTGRQVPHVNVVVDGATGAAEIVGLGPIQKETLQRLLCDCALSVNGGREVRTFSAPQRRAVAGRRRHCHFPACDRPAEWTDGHHLEYWRHGGETTAGNGALLCGFHHRLVHEGGWRLLRENEQLVAIAPSGEKFRSAKSPPAA